MNDAIATSVANIDEMRRVVDSCLGGDGNSRPGTTVYDILERTVIRQRALLNEEELAIGGEVLERLTALMDVVRGDMGSNESPASSVIPAWGSLVHHLEDGSRGDGSVADRFVGRLVVELKREMGDLERDKKLALACFLDPRFKDKFFTNRDDTMREFGVRLAVSENKKSTNSFCFIFFLLTVIFHRGTAFNLQLKSF